MVSIFKTSELIKWFWFYSDVQARAYNKRKNYATFENLLSTSIHKSIIHEIGSQINFQEP